METCEPPSRPERTPRLVMETAPQLPHASQIGDRIEPGSEARQWKMSYRLTVLVALQDGADPAHVPENAAGVLANYWEGIGTLVRAGHLDGRLLWDANGNVCQAWWRELGPLCLRVRADERDPAIYENFEGLAQAMHNMDVRAGSAPRFDDVTTVASLERRVASTRESLRLEQSLRTVILASPEVVPTAPPATAENLTQP